ncbi:ATP-grasp domain-containing protein [Chitinophaga sedimenti]|uniref:ATP-grasp domain-containing protein n=1 Tax=Chitinophaga sedimenti TaxID=2033606 RepID=UPI00249DF9B3|nr:ATP-grasp domain-containing protein [Chitinophaga sedimenti]
MNLHEYQAKELLKKYNVPVQEGIPVDTPEAAAEAYKQLKVQFGNEFAVVKPRSTPVAVVKVRLEVQNSVV